MRSTNHPHRFHDKTAPVCSHSAQEVSFPLGGYLREDQGLADLIITLVPEWVSSQLPDTPRPIGRGFLNRSKNLPASTRLP